MPEGFDNRLGDNWRLQFAIAEAAGGEWPEKAHTAAIKLSAPTNVSSVGVELLVGIKAIFDQTSAPRITSRDLIEKLTSDPESRWHEWKFGKPLTQKQLAGLLKQYGIVSLTVHPPHAKDAKGYERVAFEDVWRRYLPTPIKASKCPNAESTDTGRAFASVQDVRPDGSTNHDLSYSRAGLDAWTDASIHPGSEGGPLPPGPSGAPLNDLNESNGAGLPSYSEMTI